MSASDSESDYFDDDDFVVPDDDLPSLRPTKRPRISPFVRDNGRNNDLDDSSEGLRKDDEENSLGRSKSRSFVPKRKNPQENIFVTQLTQPKSSPDRIRGPRWKKPDPVNTASRLPSSQHSETVQLPEDDCNDDEEEALRAALAASMDAFEKENQGDPYRHPSRPTHSHPERKKDSVDASFELQDIPEDAFDSSPSLSPVLRPSQPAPAQPRSTTTSRNVQRSYRQTTLFGVVSSNPESSLPSHQDWGPPEKAEPPTQHQLNPETLSTWRYPTNLGAIRDYQFNITQKGLFHNLLVALPTGLGKTFIAATVMLNWFRWTKTAQIVFVAPTKPLVSQQVSACLDIAGIPRSQSTMLTGGASPGIRAQEWQSKRVFFMTPQTLVNDLKTGIADPKRIVLIVVDEAHRATGGYAYVEVVKFLRRFNKSFRVLALTATPGSTVESVQSVIDGLDISRVEIRTEQSIDIRDYVHARNIEVETFENSEEMTFCMDLISATLQPMVDQLRTLNAYWGKDPLTLTAYGLTKARQQWMGSDAGRNASIGLKGMVNAIFTVLASLAHAIDLLKYHGIVPFYRHLLHFKSNTDGQKGGKYQKQIVQHESFKKLLSHLGPWSKNSEFIGHPKLNYLKSVILNHFMDSGEGAEAVNASSQPATRVMIFVHFRDSAEEVTRVLKRYEPMIRPHIFVGQSSAKGSEGMNQKTHLEIINKFKDGTYNTIVATSIGEEGLDIGEIDLIVCYDSSASPIRMLQRMGRTGRKRAGNITLLLMKGKEEESYMKAKDNYEEMQQMIASGSRFTFHDDRSPRILPPGIRPTADVRQIDIPLENSQHDPLEPRGKGRAPKRPPKKFNMPDDVETGFTRASTLGEDGSGKRKATPRVGKTGVSKKQTRNPTPESAAVPSLEEFYIGPKEETRFAHRFDHSAYRPSSRTERLRGRQFLGRPTKAVNAGSVTRRTILALKQMASASCKTDKHSRPELARESTDTFDL